MMKKWFKKRFKANGGFTLIEVIVVLMIIGFLASIALPQFSKVIANSQEKADLASIEIIESALEVYRIEEGEYPTNIGNDFNALITELNGKGYLRQNEIKSADEKHFKFTYDSSTHKIKREGTSSTPAW